MLLKNLDDTYVDLTKPIMYVNVEGKKIENDNLAYADLTIEMTTGNEASFCQFSVMAEDSKCSNKNKLTVSPSLKSSFKVGASIDVYMGYVEHSKAKLVFSGYISSINFEYFGKDYIVYTIEAMDLKVFMMNNFRSEVKKDMKKYSDVVTNVLKKYSALNKGINVDTTEEISSPIEQYNKSDYDFIVDLAKKVDYMFFVVQGKVNFVDYTKISDSVLEVTPGENLFSFHREISISKQIKSVTVRTNDEQDPSKPIEGKATTVTAVGKGSKSGSDVTKIIGENMEKILIDNSVRSEAEAKARAQAELNRVSMDFISGEFESIGVPELLPGKIVTIKDIDEEIDNEYLITSVRHTFNKEGFITICKFGANKI